MSWWHVVSPCAGRSAGPVQVLLKDQGSEMLNYLGLKLRKEKHNLLFSCKNQPVCSRLVF